VIADQNANEAFIAADLLSQAEHGTDSQSILLTTNERLAQKVIQELTKQASQRSRKLILEESIKQIRIILCNDLSECFDLSNEYGPEHLIVQTTTPEQWVPMIRNAGSVFLGQWSPESIGDYASGTNHVLPTYGYAKSISGLSVDSFLKQITFQQLTAEGLMDLGPVVEKLADLEGLDAHRHAVSLRLARIKEGNLT
jgi:histidinol dehydrogenase